MRVTPSAVIEFLVEIDADGDLLSSSCLGSPAYLVANTGGAPLSCSVTPGESWVTVSATEATVPSGASVPVGIAIDAELLADLGAGAYLAPIQFRDPANPSGNAYRFVGVTVEEVDQEPDGWTVFTASPDTRIIYVSSSQGSDSNSGLSDGSPKRTIQAGLALMRDGYPDWLLLREGDRFEQFSGIVLTRSGRSPSEPMVLSTYGPAETRPIIHTRGAGGVMMTNVSNVSVAHLAFDPTDGAAAFRSDGTHPRGVFIYENCSDILIEGCLFTGFGAGIECGPLSAANANAEIAFRRNVLNSTYSIMNGQAANGVLVRLTNGLLIEENVFDRCGWNPDDPRALAPGQNHAIYVQTNNTGCVQRGNVIIRPAAAGMQCRSGGLIEQNFVTRSAGAFRIGGAGAGLEPNGWVQATMRGNVAIDGRDSSNPDGVATALRVHNADGVVIRDNLFANTSQTGSNQARAINIEPHFTWGNRAITVQENVVHDWGGRAVVLLSHASTEAAGWRFVRNRFTDATQSTQDLVLISSGHESAAIAQSAENAYWGTAVQSSWFRIGSADLGVTEFNAQVGDTTSAAAAPGYPDPTRGVGSYMATLGAGSTLDDFVDQVLLQSRFNWRTAYTAEALNDYIRAGFGLVVD